MDTVWAAGAWLLDATCKMFYLVSPQELAIDQSDPVPQYMLKQGIPMFFVMIFAEFLYMKFWTGEHRAAPAVEPKVLSGESAKKADDKAAGKPAPYRVNDMLVSTMLGSFQKAFLLAFELLGVAIEVAAYTYVYNNWRLTTVDVKNNVYSSYFIIMLGKDMGYYWMHRFMHEYHLPWTAHSVHHSGEDYDLATGLRQGAAQPFFGWPFYLPLAFMGFPPNAFAAHAQLNTLYQYWIHTDVVNRLPFGLEYILNTPMGHRLHHRPPGNRNYAAIFIIWDRMFGTYEAEVVRKDLYGLAKQPNTFDPVKLNTAHFSNMAMIGKGGNSYKSSWLYRLFARRVPARWVCNPMLLFKPIPALKEDTRANGPVRRKWDGAQSMGFLAATYFVLCSVLSTGGLVILLLKARKMNVIDALTAAVTVCGLLTCMGRLADMRKGEALRASLASVMLLATLFATLAFEPVQTWVDEAFDFGHMI